MKRTESTAEDVLAALRRVHVATNQRTLRVHVHAPCLRILDGSTPVFDARTFAAAEAWLDGFRAAWLRARETRS